MLDFEFPVDSLPMPSDTSLLERNLENWEELIESKGFTELSPKNPEIKKILQSIFGNSPYLSQSLLKEPDFFKDILKTEPSQLFEALKDEIQASLKEEKSEPELMRKLRRFKRKAALLIAMAEISGVWEVEQTTKAISETADISLQLTVSFLLKKAHEKKDINLPYTETPEKDSGFIVIGMGKMGPFELNYSSDIDIIVLYDADKVEYTGNKDIRSFFVRLTKSLIKIMDERTADGYVFRTDLRLRPDPASMPVAISVLAAEQYYECLGQNWERAAMIKARPVAGDIESGKAFLKTLVPFIWRKSLDFQAILDIHSIKRQINSRHSGSLDNIEGHDIKLGRGGIREIEFYAQTQQLIWGGRNPTLRTSGSCDSLKALTKSGFMEEKTCNELIESYRFLRTLEHRIQMVNDAQTHSLPKEPEKLQSLSIFMGFNDYEQFYKTVQSHLVRVEKHYNALFEEAPSLSDGGNLVFTGNENDPETLQTLKEMGFSNTEEIADTIRGWHHGRYRAMRTVRARELLTELIPELLKTIGKTAQPDKAFFRFDGFLRGLPSGVQLFTLFHSNPGLLNLVAEIMGDAPRLAKYLSFRPSLFDNVLAPDFFLPLPDKQQLSNELAEILKHTSGYEDILDKCRRWAKDRSFQVGVQNLQNVISGKQAGEALTDIADVTFNLLQPFTEEEFAQKHGKIKNSELCMIAFGKMGSREMTATSDVDIIFVYNMAKDAEQSDGSKTLAVSTYFARLVQRCVNAVTSLTAEGRLWEVDMRLRPSGNAGPVATSLEAFTQYQKEAAWTWEHLALTRARAVTGSEKLQNKIRKVINDTLCRKRDTDKLLADVKDMREKIFAEHGSEDIWNIKHVRGGLVDIDFTVQFLQLKHAHEKPEILSFSTTEAITNLGKSGILEKQDTEKLLKSWTLWHSIQELLSQTIEGEFNEEDAPEGLKKRIADMAKEKSFEDLKKTMADQRKEVLEIYGKTIK